MASIPADITSPDMHLDMQPDPLMSSFDHDTGNPLSVSIPPPPMVPLTTAAILSQRRRRKSSASLKRSASTPNVRGHHNSDAGMTLAEKRRNKLGYHRISIACGHCRRRKIRCLAAPDDHQGRCANCIRLKKECTFLPVDQQPTIERRPRAGSRVEGRASSSSGSSPAMASGPPFAQFDSFGAYPQLPLATQDFPSTTTTMPAGLAISPLTRGELPAETPGPYQDLADWIQVPENLRTWEFPQQPQRTSWGSPFADNGPISAGYSSPGEQSHSLWGRHSDSPGTPGYSPHLAGPTSSMQSFSDSRSSLTSFAESRSSITSFAPSRHDSAQWSVAPSRSMSYGLLEGLPMNNNYDGRHYYPQSLPKEVRRRASEMHPPSLLTSANSSTTSIGETHAGPLSAPISNDPAAQQWSNLPQSYSAFPGHVMSKSYDHGWYSDSAPLAKVQEEELVPPFTTSHEPAILYVGGEHQQ